MSNFINEQLMEAALDCDPTDVAGALKAGADPNYTRSAGLWTPLLYVAMKCRVGIDPVGSAKLLILAGADVNYVASDGSNALNFAVEGPCIELVLLLLGNSASLKASSRADYPLESLADIDIVRILLEYGADPYARGRSGVRPVENARRLRDECQQDGDLDGAKHYDKVVAMMENWPSGHG